MIPRRARSSPVDGVGNVDDHALPQSRDDIRTEQAVEPVPLITADIAAVSPESQFGSAAAIGNRAARGGMLLIVRNGLLQGLQVVSSIVLAHALTPNNYGALAIATTFVGLARAVGDLGLSESLVVRSDFEERDLSTSSVVVISTAISVGSLVAFAGVAVNAGLLSGSGPPLLAGAYAGTLLIDAMRLGPIVRLTRALKFKDIAKASTVEAVVPTFVLVPLLLAGVGLWAVIIAQYARAITGVLAYRRLGGPIARPRRGGRRGLVRHALPYQGPVILGGLVGVLLPLIVAAELDARGLGLWAWSTILAVPIAAALVTIQSVLLPSLARLYGQYQDRFSQAVDRAARLIAVAAGGGAGAIIGLAPEIIKQIFGPKWIDATGAVQVTLLGLLPLSMSLVVSAAMQARGRALPRLRCAIIASVVTLVVVYPLMLAAGVTGAALASAVVGPTVDMLLLARIAAVPLRRAAYDGSLALAAVGGASLLLGHEVHTAPELAAGCLASAVVAVPLIWAIDRSILKYAWSLLRSGPTPP